MTSMTQPDEEPKYETVRRRLMEVIQGGMRPHEPLPSERDLMQRYGVSRMTVRQAVEMLADEGLVYRVRGSGTFVAESRKIVKSLRLSSFSEDIRARHMQPGSRLLARQTVPADADVARDLFLEPGTPVIHLERLRTADGEPMCLENVWVPERLVPELAEQEEVDSLYSWLARAGADPEYADQTIRATVVNVAAAELLGVPPHSPALEIFRITHDTRGRAVERAASIYRADRYDFQLTITRGGTK